MLKFARKTPQGDGRAIAFAESGREVYRIAEKPDGWQVETWQEGFVISFRHETLGRSRNRRAGTLSPGQGPPRPAGNMDLGGNRRSGQRGEKRRKGRRKQALPLPRLHLQR